MDSTKELVATLKAGHRVHLVIAKGQSENSAHEMFNRIEFEHQLSIERMTCISAEGMGMVAWLEGLAENQIDIGLLRRRGGK